ncbi:sigma-70 family RNA polymerase sigma factor [Kribbella sindirgiensis]|uniref:Sigma-70 family RNA polymerase sigma factor n=1 Tax=Kribbella sindirgiensis TaxID=1124744 RepID=A0A4R0I9J7_9ACTN|nr:sigma-70 family RNA polymerase sigma factor [Kribbella sindirgiensis]TCC28400.1 sigma-70 family RNA polymerase sigma factor [Kribbella sindirgiensis]
MTTLEEAAFAGDETAFAALAGQYRRELHVHCYRMLGSYDEAEDAVQDTFLRAWRARDTYDGRTYFRAWLYKIATNICLDVVRRPAARDLVWLQPYPDRLLDEVAPSHDQPDVVAVDRETIELTFLIALQELPARQRAALIARDVLGWSAAETAGLLDTSVAAANSALQRARVTMQQRLPARRTDWSVPEPTAQEREVLARFIDAHQRCDAAAAIAIAAEDLRISMPPDRLSFDGLTACLPLFERGLGPDRDGEWRLVPTSANRLPAAASYLLRPGDTVWRAFKLDVLWVDDGKITEIMTFGYSRFPAFGLPDQLTP